MKTARFRSAPWAFAALGGMGVLTACSSTPASTASRSQPPISPPSASAPLETPSPATPAPFTIPAGFSPESVTFVSASAGFVLGTYPCPAPLGCLALLRTTNAGHTWSRVPAPPAQPSQGDATGVRRLRFATANDGWAFDPELWTTHDAGGHWVRQSLPVDGEAQSLEVDAGVVHALVLDQGGVQILSSPVTTDSWTPSATTISAGAGPVSRPQLVLQGGAGWAIEVNRTVVGGARLAAGRWAAWQPPCATAGGDAALAAATATSVVAVCDEGTWTGGSQSVHLYLSADGGASFRRVPAPLPILGASSVTRSLAGAMVVGGSDATGGVLLASFDGGSTWATVYRGGERIADDELGFTTATQGVAISQQGTTGRLLMTYDGGRHWDAVAFG